MRDQTKPATTDAPASCGDCRRTVGDLDTRGRCAPCADHHQRYQNLRKQAQPLVLQWLRTRRLVQRKNDLAASGHEVDEQSCDFVFLEEQTAALDLLQFLGGGLRVNVLLDVLNEHFATDYSETTEPTLRFTPEFDRVLASGGLHDFERFAAAEETSAEAERAFMACPMTHLPEMACGTCGKPVETSAGEQSYGAGGCARCNGSGIIPTWDDEDEPCDCRTDGETGAEETEHRG
jgi:hypothetical protein